MPSGELGARHRTREGRRGLDPHRGSPQGPAAEGKAARQRGGWRRSARRRGVKQGRQRGGVRAPSVRAGGSQGPRTSPDATGDGHHRLPGGVQAVQQQGSATAQWGQRRGGVAKPLPRENRVAGGDGRARSEGCRHLTMGRQQAKVTPGAACAHVPFETTQSEGRRTRLGRGQPGGWAAPAGAPLRSTAATLRRVRTAAKLEVSHHPPRRGRGAPGQPRPPGGRQEPTERRRHDGPGRTTGEDATRLRPAGRRAGGRQGPQRQGAVRGEARKGRAGGLDVKTPSRGGPVRACRQTWRLAAEGERRQPSRPRRRGREGGRGSELETAALPWPQRAKVCARVGAGARLQGRRGGDPARDAEVSESEVDGRACQAPGSKRPVEPGGALAPL